jgi:hypothetical protein
VPTGNRSDFTRGVNVLHHSHAPHVSIQRASWRGRKEPTADSQGEHHQPGERLQARRGPRGHRKVLRPLSDIHRALQRPLLLHAQRAAPRARRRQHGQPAAHVRQPQGVRGL